MTYLKVGRYVNTHGLKGEIKIITYLNNLGSIYNIGNTIYIGKEKLPFTIASYRKHQKFDMLTLNGLDSIEKILPYKGNDVYLNRDDIKDDIIIYDLINYDVYNNDKCIGKVIEILNGVKNDFLVISDKRIIIPYIDHFVINIDKDKKIIKTSYLI